MTHTHSAVTDVLDFVTQQLPFSTLPASCAHFFVNHAKVVYITALNQAELLSSEQKYLYLVRSGVFDLVDNSGEVVTRLGEGDYFGYPSLLTGEDIQNHLEVQTGGLIFLLPQEDFDFLRREYPQFEQHFVRAHKKRLLSSHFKERGRGWSEQKISTLMCRTAVTIEPKASVVEAAKVMHKAGVSSVIITENGQLSGIVTDRDLRNRVLAAELDPRASVTKVMTRDPKFIFENNRAFAALHLMLKHNIHHLPVLNEERMPLGMVTSTDLLRQQKHDPVQLIGQIYKANSHQEVVHLAKEVPALLRGFSNTVEDISFIGTLLSGLTDAMTSRLTELFIKQQGEPPCRFCWICFGSQAREEQTLHSDQDNGLIVSNSILPHQRAYFAKLGEFVTGHLISCGIKACPGGIMASNEQCRGTVDEWLMRFEQWCQTPTPQAMLNSKIFFDRRFMFGDQSLYQALNAQLNNMQKQDIFFAAMATDISANSVPMGLFQQFKLQRDKRKHGYLDLKTRGVAIVNDLARIYALKCGLTKANTQARLEALKAFSILSKEDIYNLQDCWRFLTQLRFRIQIEDLDLPPNCINPEHLSSLERHQLKEAFHLIKQAQQACVFKFARGSL
ncbi:DUF294 nucleotidyltransferase-like domain-containing protein [Pseudoalteromonas luteoviolacea]|uniref:DUF294 nucleotidyltransferase-like domain-containing protein n=1 Tax=Pseudoalteromonas luteoviolacea TaxID=43657 RepID=UPI001EEDFD66|nr:DUF294 nucleotidyltransferase-like domain-containing protein [Pseudoalteromonas luteoviolacea]MCF6440108.1 DUF294 nucleotidyltransferase-like domain-containing protein [Pseudoalteromonas luteoviolacea]